MNTGNNFLMSSGFYGCPFFTSKNRRLSLNCTTPWGGGASLVYSMNKLMTLTGYYHTSNSTNILLDDFYFYQEIGFNLQLGSVGYHPSILIGQTPAPLPELQHLELPEFLVFWPS